MPGRRISSENHAQIQILHEEGYTTREIGNRLQLTQKTVSRSINNFYSSGKYGFEKPSGRPRATTKRMDDAILLAAKKSPKKSSKAIEAGLPQEGKVPSQRTIRRRLFDAGLKSYKPAKKPRLSSKNIADRLAFCQKYKDWSNEQWKRVMFSDETLISQFYAFCRHVRRPPNKRDDYRYIVPSVKNAPKVMIWGGICAGGRCGLWFLPQGQTIKGATYLEILQTKVPQFMEIKECTHFQHDGAPCHQIRAVKQWLSDSGFEILGPWPGNSPDLNPIEHCWGIMKQKVAARNPTSLSELKKAITEVWTMEISTDLCKSLCLSMPNRIDAIIRNKGLHTKY